MEDLEGKKILVIQTHGVETPRRTYSPLFYAMAAAAMEMEVMVWFTMVLKSLEQQVSLISP